MSNRTHQAEQVFESAPKAAQTDAPTTFWRLRLLLQDLRQMWSVDPGTSQPALRDYPLRRSSGGVR